MNIKEWIKDNKLLSIVAVVVIIYILIVLGTKKAPVDKEEAPAKTVAELPTEKVEAPTEKAVVPETTPVARENESVKEPSLD